MKRPLLLGILLLCSACRDRGVEEYREEKPAPVPAARPVPGHSGEALVWDDPAGWARLPAEGMRLASYRVKGPDGEADVSIVRLEGAAGGAQANIERWRGQLGLTPLGGEKAFEAASRRIGTKAGEAVLVDFLGAEGAASSPTDPHMASRAKAAPGARTRTTGDPSIPPSAAREENRPRARMLGAVLPRTGETWFLKMTGPEKTVGGAKDAFVRLLSGLRPAR